MVFMAGVNNLNIDMAYALKDIREAARTMNERVNLMVFYDGSSGDAPTLYCDFSDFKKPLYVPAYTIEKRYENGSQSQPANPQNQNAAEAYSLMNFVDWCVNPKKRGKTADRYALILSGHGFGFQSISFLRDDSSDSSMTIKEFRFSLEKICKEILEREKIDLIGFDSCVMGMLEVGYEIRESAAAMIASEGSIPNAGWTYGNILGDLVSSSAEDTYKVAGQSVRAFIESQKEFAVGGVSVDMSAWDLTKVENVVSAANKLGEVLLMGLLKESPVYEPLRRALVLSHLECQSYMFEQNVDLKDFCERLLDVTGELVSDEKITLDDGYEANLVETLKERCTAVTDEIDACVLDSGFSGGMYQYSNGIAIFFPWTFETYLFSERSYEDLNFANNGGADWNAFLTHFLREVTLRGQNSRSGLRNEIMRFRETEGEKITHNPASRIIQNPANRIIENATNRIIANPKNRIIANPANRIIANPKNRAYNYPAYRIIDNTASRSGPDLANRIIANPKNRIIANPKNRMMEVQELTLANFKNIAMPWDIFGYPKDEQDEKREKSEAARSSG